MTPGSPWSRGSSQREQHLAKCPSCWDTLSVLGHRWPWHTQRPRELCTREWTTTTLTCIQSLCTHSFKQNHTNNTYVHTSCTQYIHSMHTLMQTKCTYIVHTARAHINCTNTVHYCMPTHSTHYTDVCVIQCTLHWSSHSPSPPSTAPRDPLLPLRYQSQRDYRISSVTMDTMTSRTFLIWLPLT